MIREISKYTFYAVLLISYLIIQTHLKEMPQLVVLSIALAMTLLNYLNWVALFRLFTFLLILIYIYCFVFQALTLIWDWADTARGFSEINGEDVPVGMDLSGLYFGALSFIVAVIGAIANLNNNRGKSIKIENQLAVATIISSGVIFIFFELI